MKKWKYGNEEIEVWKWAALLSHRILVSHKAWDRSTPVALALGGSVDNSCDCGPEKTQQHNLDISSEDDANLQHVGPQLDHSPQLNSSPELDHYPQLDPSPKLNHSLQVDHSSRLDPSSYYRNTMAKLGTDQEFDITSQCPKGSYMRNRNRYSLPQHTDCPTLFIVGARKGGTTSLYQYVSKHPNFMALSWTLANKLGSCFTSTRKC